MYFSLTLKPIFQLRTKVQQILLVCWFAHCIVCPLLIQGHACVGIHVICKRLHLPAYLTH
jgi:hypothetical protein